MRLERDNVIAMVRTGSLALDNSTYFSMFVRLHHPQSSDASEPAPMGFGHLNLHTKQGSMKFYTEIEEKISALTPVMFATAERIQEIHMRMENVFKACVLLLGMAMFFGMLEDQANAVVILGLLEGIAAVLFFLFDSAAKKYLENLKFLMTLKSNQISSCASEEEKPDLDTVVGEIADYVGDLIRGETWPEKWTEARILLHHDLKFALVAVNDFKSHQIDLYNVSTTDEK